MAKNSSAIWIRCPCYFTWVNNKCLGVFDRCIHDQCLKIPYFISYRLTPLYMIVLMVYTCLWNHLGEGPNWPFLNVEAENCKNNWWTNLLYIQNLVNHRNMVRHPVILCLLVPTIWRLPLIYVMITYLTPIVIKVELLQACQGKMLTQNLTLKELNAPLKYQHA